MEEQLWEGTPPAYMAHEQPEAASDGSRDPRVRNRHISHVTVPRISIFSPIGSTRSDMAIIVCPGGGYNVLAIDKEGYDVALWLNRMGITAAVLKYRLRPCAEDAGTFPPLLDIQRAIRIVRGRADALDINPHRIGVMGFSAGGHLALLAGLHHDSGDPDADDPIERIGCRPDFLVPIYPGIPGDELQMLSPEMPPAFIAIAWDDFLMESNIAFLEAAHRVRIPLEYHILPSGGHGYGLGVQGGPVARWPGLCERWLNDQIASMPPYEPSVTRPVPEEEGFHKRIVCGRFRDWQDEDGHVWEGDWRHTCDGSTVDRGAIEIDAPRVAAVYTTERYGLSHYRVPVPGGDYRVVLHFAETYEAINEAGRRVFGVSIEGKPVLEDFDVFKEAGGRRNAAVVRTFNTRVEGGELKIEFHRGQESPLINGIEILAAAE
jgi:acetyl esterase/lipase